MFVITISGVTGEDEDCYIAYWSGGKFTTKDNAKKYESFETAKNALNKLLVFTINKTMN